MARSTTILNVHTLNQPCHFKRSILMSLCCTHVQADTYVHRTLFAIAQDWKQLKYLLKEIYVP